MSSDSCFLMSLSVGLGLQDIQLFFSTLCGRLSLIINLPTSEYVSPQFGGSWALESSSLCHHPTVNIALNRTIRDGVSYVNCLTPIPEEWLVERNWFMVNHWEDQFCRDVYQNLCEFIEFQHLRAVAQLSPGTTPRVCPVDNMVNTHPVYHIKTKWH